MNYVKQAFELSAPKKQHAIALYKLSLAELVHKDFERQINDAHVELSAIFGAYWVMQNRGSGMYWLNAELYAEANVAFNYANLQFGVEGKFMKLAKELVADSERLSDSEIAEIEKQMNCILTYTTAEKIRSRNKSKL